MIQKPIRTCIFGSTHQKVTRTGLGGEGILRTHGRNRESREVIEAAIDQGIRYFDSARVYADSELYYGQIWKDQPQLRAEVFQASKSASRRKADALADLQQTLARLQTEYLDLWQIHDVRTDQDIALIAGSGGALEAFVEARASGKVRAIGVTGHHDPAVLTQAVREWPLDTVMLPVNPVEEVLGGFLTQTLPAAREKRMGIIAMKVLGAGHYMLPRTPISAAALIRYAFSFDIDVAIVGCATPAEVKNLADSGRITEPLDEKERHDILQIFKPIAHRLAFYRGAIH